MGKHADAKSKATHVEQLVDPELRALLESFAPMELSADSLPHLRQGVGKALSAMPRVDDEDLVRQDVSFPGAEGDPPVRAVVYRPAEVMGKLPVIIDLHGGGMVLGAPEMNDARNSRLVRDCRCAIVSVDYRLAPDAQAPDNLEDCYAALCWLKSDGRPSWVDASRVVVMGQSAGGGLAAALALLVRDRGEHSISALVLLSPMLDDRTGTEPFGSQFFVDRVWSASSNVFGWSALLGQPAGSAVVSHYAAPARASDLSGLPPTYIDVGALDMFVHEDVQFARRLIDDGVAVELHVYPGAYHGFQMAEDAGVSKRAYSELKEALQRLTRYDPASVPS